MTDAASESPDFSNQALFTPAMRQFIEVKNRYPNTLVLFRMGDFYETFFKDAVIANRLIGITLTKTARRFPWRAFLLFRSTRISLVWCARAKAW